jgi:hypothetical protein
MLCVDFGVLKMAFFARFIALLCVDSCCLAAADMRSSFIVPELRVIIGNGLFVSLNLIVRLLAMFGYKWNTVGVEVH